MRQLPWMTFRRPVISEEFDVDLLAQVVGDCGFAGLKMILISLKRLGLVDIRSRDGGCTLENVDVCRLVRRDVRFANRMYFIARLQPKVQGRSSYVVPEEHRSHTLSRKPHAQALTFYEAY